MVEKIMIYTSAKEQAREKILGVSFIIYQPLNIRECYQLPSFLKGRNADRKK